MKKTEAFGWVGSFFFWVLVASIFSAIGLGPFLGVGQSSVSVPAELNEAEEFRKSVTTIGNTSWISLDLAGTASEHVTDILLAKSRFEDFFPELEITGWKIQEESPRNNPHKQYVEGLWIDHHPREKVLAEKAP